MLIDKVRIEVSAGNGGDGITSFHRAKYVPCGAPDGGNGGAGGDIIVKAFNGIRTLRLFRSRTNVRSEVGGDGSKNRRSGKMAPNEIIQVPIGTIVRDADTKVILADLQKEGEDFIVAHGGRGGRGNMNFVSSIHRSPLHSEKGQPGEKRVITLELKLLADVGLVGLPNAGKSSLLSRISSARPKIADYPFATIEPMLGVVFLNVAHEGYVVADLPGLVEGAHEGKGLGTHFLKHIERARLILHLVDLTAENPVQDFIHIRNELAAYASESENLAEKPFLVAGTKTDLIADQVKIEALKQAVQSAGLFEQKIFSGLDDDSYSNQGLFHIISSADGDGIEVLLNALGSLLDKVGASVPFIQRETVVYGDELLPYMVERISGTEWNVRGKKVEDLAAMTKFEERESVMRFHKKLDRMGVLRELSKQGAKSGDIVCIGEVELNYEPDL